MELSAKIARQIEFYFSDANLRRDKFMQEQLKKNADGFIPITVLLTFARLKALSTEVDVVADAVSSESEILRLNEERNSISRVTPFVDTNVSNDQVKACTAYLNRIPADATIESLKQYFSEFGEVSLVRIPKSKDDSGRLHRGFAFVEFISPEAVAKLVAAIPRKPSQEVSDEKAPETEAAVKVETDVAVEVEGVQGETPAETAVDVKPKPMYALTMAEWKEWSATVRKEKKNAPVPESPHEVGRLVRVSGNLDGATKQDLLAIFSDLGKIKYVDFYGDAKFATIRFATAEIAKEVVAKVAEGNVKFGDNVLEATILSAEEQEKYWEKVHAETAARAVMPKNRKRQQFKNDKKRSRVVASGETGSPKKVKTSEENAAA